MADSPQSPPRPTLPQWNEEQLQRFLETRQEFFLDPLGSNKERFLEAAFTLQRALFDWYLIAPGKFKGMLALVNETAAAWSELRKEERRTLLARRFALNNSSPDLPAVESSVSEHQWQRIFGSLGLGLTDPGTFDRFLVQLDEETNPSLRVNHRYLGELLPHDNMISYLSSITATFLNENAIIGKVSPCVTHMEQAAVKWLLSLVGWDGEICAAQSAETTPVQRLPTLPVPAEQYLRWEREEPTGAIVAGGTIANISALLMARSAVFDYLLGWSGAVQWLGPMLAWDLVRKVWGKKRLVVLTSKGAHYSIRKAALQAGVAPGNVIEVAGSENPWILDGTALRWQLSKMQGEDLILAVAVIAGKTETGYVDRIQEVADVLNEHGWGEYKGLPALGKVVERLRQTDIETRDVIQNTLRESKSAIESFLAAKKSREENNDSFRKLLERCDGRDEVESASHHRLFLHVDAAHGGGFLTIPELRGGIFQGIEFADTVTIDGHKSFYCYYPCGGLLVRATRWAQTFSLGHSAYISEDENRGAYREGLAFARALEAGSRLTVETRFDGNTDYSNRLDLDIDEGALARLHAVYQLTRRPIAADRSELTHQPFGQYLEGSRGPQGIMQLYFNLATLGLRGYRSILGWSVLLRQRAEEAISLGMSDIRLVTDPPLPEDLKANDKQAAIRSAGSLGPTFEDLRKPLPATVVPIAGGRFLRLSAGDCNQLLLTYVPAREAKLIATASHAYWVDRGPREVLRVMRYLWRVNEHLWDEHLYANPHFTYYLGHTTLDLALPSTENNTEAERASAADRLAKLLAGWNAWTKQKDGRNPFLQILAANAEQAMAREASTDGPAKQDELKPYARKFFCHKVVVMHPYSDESLIGDMLRRLAFWGERSVADVQIADSAAQFLFPDRPEQP